jgi:hypothetical protein
MQYDAEIIISPERTQPFVITHRRQQNFEEWLFRLVPRSQVRDYAASEPGYVTREISQDYLEKVTGLVKSSFSNYSISRGSARTKSKKAVEGQLDLFSII